MEAIKSNETETVFAWDELNERQQQVVLAAHSKITNKKHLLERVFDLGRPKIVIGENYCRIHADSVEVMKILVRQYL